MPKTPDEIKRGLGEAIAEASWVVDDGDMHDLRDACDTARKIMADAIALIQRLGNDASFYKSLTAYSGRMIDEQNSLIQELVTKMDQLLTKVKQLQTERDTLISDFREYDELPCALCAHYDKGPDEIPCKYCDAINPADEDRVSQWEWRGVQKEE